MCSNRLAQDQANWSREPSKGGIARRLRKAGQDESERLTARVAWVVRTWTPLGTFVTFTTRGTYLVSGRRIRNHDTNLEEGK